jgi:phosphoglycolate phosphatase-like HAD superfamily hydrolase
MTRSIVILDLDNTLIEEERTARSSFNEVAHQLGVGDHRQSSSIIRDAVRSVWHCGPHHDRCLELGIASWEGLWSTFDGNHPIDDGLVREHRDYWDMGSFLTQIGVLPPFG